ncbi:hypothetical protein JCM11491_000601 [Sporobolomyces phaffii]
MALKAERRATSDSEDENDDTSSSASSSSSSSSTSQLKQATPTSTTMGRKSDDATNDQDRPPLSPWDLDPPEPGPMQDHQDETTTIRTVATANGFTFECPNKRDAWQDVTVGKELQAKVAQGPGCYMDYTFTGDSIQIYGTTGTEAGIFGCFVTTPQWNASGWWDAGGGATLQNAYQGSCKMQGLGYGEHTVRLVNSPEDPKKLYFTGVRYSTNETQVPWSARKWDGCCPVVTWPDGKSPVIEIGGASPPSRAGANNPETNGVSGDESPGVLPGVSNGTVLFLVQVRHVLQASTGRGQFRREPQRVEPAATNLARSAAAADDDHHHLGRSSSSSSSIALKGHVALAATPGDDTTSEGTASTERDTSEDEDGTGAGGERAREQRRSSKTRNAADRRR